MASEKNITMRQYNGTDYDTLYPKTIASQVDGVYNKTEILTAATAALYGLGADAVPDDVFALLRTLVSNAQSSADIRAKIETGSYDGTSSGKTKSIIFSFAPKLVFIFGGNANFGSYFSAIIPCMNLGSTAKTYPYLYCSGEYGHYSSNAGEYYKASLKGTTLQLSTSITSLSNNQWEILMNRSGYTYKYIAIA